VTALRLVAVVGSLLMLAGCTGSSNDAQPGPSFSPNPDHQKLVRQADLDPCPPSSTTSASGGLPDITLPCLGDGPSVHLAGLSGKPTLVNIWATWCRPCLNETRYLSTVYDALRPRVRFLGVDTEEASTAAALAFAPHVRPPMHYPSVYDDDRSVLAALGTNAVPMTVFVDASGRVVHREFGPYRDVATLRADIGRYLGVTG
jgi:thiol-disulfide isomerase/thioredoxin